MNTLQPSFKQNFSRKRRAHRKSRAGCRNCKFRKVKCDEVRPACRNCAAFLVKCNYDSAPAADSRLLVDNVLDFSLSETHLANNALVITFNQVISPQYPDIPELKCIRPFDKSDIDRLIRWHTRTVFTLGTQGISLCYQQLASKEASKYPYLLHAILAMTAMHDRYLQASNSQSTIRIREIQYYHHSCAAALFKRRLSRLDDYPPHDRNAIWTAGAMLSNMSAFIPKPDRPEETWPLATDSDSNLNWLHFSRALPTLYRLALPFDASSMFFDLYHDEEHKTLVRKWEEDGREGTEGIPPSFIHLFSLMPSSNAENNPYHAAVRSLLQIWDMPATRCNAFRFLSFISLLRPEMRDLLVRKDPRALLLLAYWYTKMFDIHWWFQNRAVAECSAICIYLQKNEFSNSLLMKMVQYPLSMVAALQSGKEVDC